MNLSVKVLLKEMEDDRQTDIDSINSEREGFVNLISEQQKELKLKTKRLEKLEEKFVKTNTDLKNVLKDKQNIENFFKTIFPRDMHENIIKTDYGLYDTSELNKFWLICESKNQSEFNKYLNQAKKENDDLKEKLEIMSKEVKIKTLELNASRNKYEQLNEYMNSFTEMNKKIENLENEKNYLLELISQKDEELRNFSSLELEMAELKAKVLLEDLDTKVIFEKKPEIVTNTPAVSEKIKISNRYFTIGSLNTASQTTEPIYGVEYVNNMEKQISELKNKNEKLKKEFSVSL
jgi:hypothetical protein